MERVKLSASARDPAPRKQGLSHFNWWRARTLGAENAIENCALQHG